MLLKCECNYKDTINYGIMWIVSYIRIFVERFIVVYAFYPKKKNRAHARLWNIKKVKCQGIRLPVSHHFPLFWILVEEIHHRTQCKTKVVQLQVYNKIWILNHLSSSKYISLGMNLQYLAYFLFRWHVWWENSRILKRLNCWKASNWRACYRK